MSIDPLQGPLNPSAGINESQSGSNDDSSNPDDVARLRAATQQAAANQAESNSKTSPESLLAGDSEAPTEEEGMQAYVEGFLVQMMSDNLKKAGTIKSEDDGW